MSKHIFLAGASGTIGRRLLPQLLEAGHQVSGMTRSRQSAQDLERQGVAAVVVDVFDGDRLRDVIKSARPEIVIHQLTDLSLLGSDPDRSATAISRNARIRTEGTRNLVQASLAAGARRIIAQSIAWAYAPGPKPYSEDDPLDGNAPAPRSTTVGGVVALEDAVLRSPGLRGTVLRYGHLYGPHTTSAFPMGETPVHVDAAARAALLAADRDVTGIFNIAEPNSSVTTDKAESKLDWDHTFRLPPELERE
jgi:nucleoside-diphosphate-sugar epimerase